MRGVGPTAMAALLVAGCAPVDATFEEPDLDFNRMLEQPRYDAYAASQFFADRAVMRRPPKGAVPFAREKRKRHPPSAEQLEAGRNHFQTICAPCHGVAGYGDTPVADRMKLRPPPSLHTPKARNFSEAQLRDIVRDGYGLMPGYAYVLERKARFAVVSYLRALQLSQHVEVTSLPPDMRRKLEGVKP